MNFCLCNFDDNQEKRLQASNKEIGEVFWVQLWINVFSLFSAGGLCLLQSA